jgi:hypothetical protein
MRARLALALLAIALLGPTPAAAQSSSGLFVFGAGATPVATKTIPVRMSGQLTVDYHGDPAAGCAAHGLCGYAGEVSWRPPASGQLEVTELRSHRHVSYDLELFANVADPAAVFGGVTTAQVADGSASCVDATSTGTDIGLPVGHGKVEFTLAGAGPLLETRCAGPLDADVLPALPAPRLALRAVLRGHTTLALAASRGFSSHGFAGTIDSTLTFALGRPGKTHRIASGQLFPGGKERYRELVVSYRATVSGSVVAHVTGASDPDVCALLGSCGLSGTLTLMPRATGAKATVTVEAPARRPERDLLAAVGLSDRGDPRGISAYGGVTWNRGGVLDASLTQGYAACLDSAPLAGGFILIALLDGRWGASYTPTGLRTRCPGPEPNAPDILAGARIPRAELARRKIRLSFTVPIPLVDYGYALTTVPHLTVTLTRVHVSSKVDVAPSGLF